MIRRTVPGEIRTLLYTCYNPTSWIALMHRIQEISSLNLGPETNYLD
jgi:hypothetical protein